jgi:hypothetical protein
MGDGYIFQALDDRGVHLTYFLVRDPDLAAATHKAEVAIGGGIVKLSKALTPNEITHWVNAFATMSVTVSPGKCVNLATFAS